MNILTFDIEDWYNCDFISGNNNWDHYESRIEIGLDKILFSLSELDIKATFFCLGWVAEKHPQLINKIHNNGHHIGCHSYKHELVYNLQKDEFYQYTKKAKSLIEDLIGLEVNSYRAPGFSITENSLWALEILAKMGFKYDCSIFPINHDYGGFPKINIMTPKIIQVSDNLFIKEFPINAINILNMNIVFSGDGYFRLLPYKLISHFSTKSSYLMAYFHPRDFDPNQPIISTLPLMRKFKSYYGLKSSYNKYLKFINDVSFINIEDADKFINWDNIQTINLSTH